MSEITEGSTPTKSIDILGGGKKNVNKAPKAGPKLSEQPGFGELPADDKDRILRAEAKRDRKYQRRVLLNEKQKRSLEIEHARRKVKPQPEEKE